MVSAAPILQPPLPYHEGDSVTLYNGDSLEILRRLPTGSFDAVITDPPYSSGGLMRSDRNQNTSDKYTLNGTATTRPEFFGDNRDQRSFTYWCSLWMGECVRIVKPGGYLMSFTDWRQLPAISDAIQAGGWVWRGVVAWDKTEASRPQKGWFRTGQMEYIMLASNGGMAPEQTRDGPCQGGVWRGSVNAASKQHITAKPVALMMWLMSVLPKGAAVLDPFAGSGSTLVAAKEMAMQSTGIEMSPVYCEVIKNRLSQSLLSFPGATGTVMANPPFGQESGILL